MFFFVHKYICNKEILKLITQQKSHIFTSHIYNKIKSTHFKEYSFYFIFTTNDLLDSHLHKKIMLIGRKHNKIDTK